MTAVVTEQGVAEVFGLDQHRQAANIIDHAAHPNARARLWKEAASLGFVSV
jgi:acyl-CoA hydrolase